MISGWTFAMRCRRYAETLRRLAKTAKQGESQEPLLKFAEEFDAMAQRAAEPAPADTEQHKPEKPQ